MAGIKTQRTLPPLWACMAGAAIILLAWGMFVHHVGYESMILDEDLSWRYGTFGPMYFIQESADNDVHPALHYLWVWLWMGWTGQENLTIVRLSSVIVATLAVAVCYRIGTDWFGSRWAGLAAAGFLTTSGLFVYYARELRMYSLIVLLACISWWFLWRLCRGKAGGWLGYAASVGLMAYTYYFTAFVVPAQIVVVILFYRRRLWKLAQAYLLAGLAFLPWLPSFLSQIQMEKGNEGDRVAPIGKFLGTTPTSIRSITELVNAYTGGQPGLVLLLIVLAVAFGVGVSQGRRWLTAAFLWLLLTVGLFFAVNLVIPVYGLRYTLTAIPGLALVAGLAIYRLPSQRARVLALGAVLVASAAGHSAAFPAPATPNRDLMRTVSDRYHEGDRVWYNMTAGARGSYLQDMVAYHLRFDGPKLRPSIFVWDAPNDYRDTTKVQRVWDVRPYWIGIPDAAWGPLIQGRAIAEEYEFGGYTVRLYEAPPLNEKPVDFGDMFEMLPVPLDITTYHPGDMVVVKEWWRARQAPGKDYSFGLYLRGGSVDPGNLPQTNAGLTIGGKPTALGLVADARPQRPGAIPTQPTSAWAVSDSYGLSSQQFSLPTTLTPGEYELWMGVYYWQDPARLGVTTSGDTTVDENLSLARVATFSVK